jgi:hypothetical protein
MFTIKLTMTRWLTPALAVGFLCAAIDCLGQPACPVMVRESVELSGESLSLADLLAPDTCPELLQVAAQVRLGSAPHPGAMRVMEGEWLRNLIETILHRQQAKLSAPSPIRMPERVIVSSSGLRLSCAEIAGEILQIRQPALLPVPHAGETPVAHNLETAVDASALDTSGLADADCGPARGIPRGASLEVIQQRWDPTLASWIFLARCSHAADCVPFAIRVKDTSRTQGFSVLSTSAGAQARRSEAVPVVRRGEAVTLLWNQDGILLTVSAVCLDGGVKGDSVRARITTSGRVLRAIVVERGTLQVSS